MPAQKSMRKTRHTGSRMRCQLGTTRYHSMTMATAMSEKAKFTSAKSTFCTGKTNLSTFTFLSSGAAAMNEVRAAEVESDMKLKVMLPTMR